MADPTIARSRLKYGLVAVVVVLLGLASRSSFARVLPEVVAEYSGDSLWALLVYVLFAIARPAARPRTVALSAATFALLIEVSQLYEADWANSIRDLPGARLVFGYGFLWSDLACYAAGIAIGWSAERIFWFRAKQS